MTDLAWMRPKLAELCGVKVFVSSFEQYDPSGWRIGDGPYIQGQWRPDEDVAQAIRCLDSLNNGEEHEYLIIKSSTQMTNHWECQLQYADSTIIEKSNTPQQAICLAVAAALGWEKP